MGHEHEGDADVALDLLELELHRPAQLEVEGAEGLVEEQHARAVDQRPGQGDALALAARELGGPAGGGVAELDGVEGRHRALAPLGARDLLDPQAVLDVGEDVHVREERVVLEHRVDVPGEGRAAGHVLAGEVHPAGGRLLEAGDHPQHRRLARAARAEHREELAVVDREVHVVDGGDVAEGLAQADELDG